MPDGAARLTLAIIAEVAALMQLSGDPDSAALAPRVAAALHDGDVVLVKGSLGSRMKCVVEALVAAAEDGTQQAGGARAL